MSTQVYFIISCARSGSTSLHQILSQATNGRCVSEPSPDLNRECRDSMDGRLAEDPVAVLERTVFPRVQAALGTTACYGEKHVTYGPFLRHMQSRLGCKFIFIQRDGRDVVRSLLDWHNLRFGSIYREAFDIGCESPAARTAASNLLVHHDTSDYARPRPKPGDPLFNEWERLTRFEMCAYYWSRINNLYLDELSQLSAESWITIDYKKPTASDVLRVADFIGLEGLSTEIVAGMLDKRINSVGTRAQDEAAQNPAKAVESFGQAGFPNWRTWSPELTSKFYRLAGSTMQRLGYAST